MAKILVAVDGSETSTRAVDHLLKIIDQYRTAPEIHLLNVQPPLSGAVTMFIRADQVKQFHNEEGMKALAPARAKLDAAKVAYRFEVKVGEPGETIAAYAKETRCDQICMGTRGPAHVAGMLLGSVAIKVIHLADVPILLVK